MKKNFIPEMLFLLVLAFLFVMKSIGSEKLIITTSFQTGHVRIAKDKGQLKNSKSDYIAVEVKQEKQDQH